VAVNRALDMAASGYFSHYNASGVGPVELLQQYGIPYRAMAENIARSSSPVPEMVNVVHAQLMASASHRRNSLNPEFNRVGIAIASSNGMFYVAVEFLD
jgi:uncharacterized protein YkwD